MSGLIDTTEMYLRTIYELIEEEIPPMRARIAERLDQSGPTVSQTVARMERDGLLRVSPDRIIELSSQGHQLAEDVMRKHRLAECLLVDLIGLEWELAHAEACRWEHVISEDVERKLLVLLKSPTHSPFGNPIPGLGRLKSGLNSEPFMGSTTSLSQAARAVEQRVVLIRISEQAQETGGVLAELSRAGMTPGQEMSVRRSATGVVITTELACIDLDAALADHLYVQLCPSAD